MNLVEVLNEVNRQSDERTDKIAPIEILKTMTNGRSGAGVYMVEYGADNKVGILKITDSMLEVHVFNNAYDVAVKNNMNKYISRMVANYSINIKNKVLQANLYDLAGDDIYNVDTFLDKVINEDEIKDNVMSKITKFAFMWNKEHTKKFLSPMDIIKGELGYRLMDEKLLETFHNLHISSDKKWISLDGTEDILPNPYYFFSNNDAWGDLKITCLTSYAHGDFQGNNIMITEVKPIIIDFCDVIEDCNVFHDIRYLESITLSDYMSFGTEFDRELWVKICKCITEKIHDVEIPRGKGMSLLRQLIPKFRENIKLVVCDNRNVLYNPSFYLAGVACGLINMRKIKDELKQKAAFIYAAYNLKMFMMDESVNMYKPKLDSCMTLPWVDLTQSIYDVKLVDKTKDKVGK